MVEKNIEGELAVLLEEGRRFFPPKSFSEKANIKDENIYEEAKNDREGFWAKFANELHWFKKWDRVLEWDPPHAKWFVGGKINVSYNCVDRHIQTGVRNKAAIIWEGEQGDQRTLTYWDLYREVNKFANVLKSLGVEKGDRIAIYMPMIPELPIAMLACARVGAVHTVVFGGFSAESLRDRINDAQAKVLIAADGGYRRGGIIPLKHDADYAIKETPSIKHVVIVERGRFPLRIKEGRDHWWHRLMQEAKPYCEPEPMDAEDMLYTLYTSGTTGKPKGIIHTTGGYLTGVYATTKLVFDLKDDDVYWCTADIGWVTGHSYVVYGPLALGATVVMYEGAPDWPDRDRFWQIVEKYGVTIFYTAPTAIRAFMKWGIEWLKKHNLSSLRLLGTVGEPINPEAWMWYHKYVGQEKCPVVDTWWQTETGMILITPLPGITPLKPGSATKPFPGVDADVLNEKGESVKIGGGYLAITSPWPAMLRGIYGDPERYIEQYWSKWNKGIYFTADGAKRDEEGYFWLLGRVDDVMSVAGHRISTMEVESALVDHPGVAESAVVGIPHEIKGQVIVAFVTIKDNHSPGKEMEDELKEHVVKKIGSIARPERIIFSADLPKTRSGKIMRRLLRDIAEGKVLGDTTTLADPGIVEKLKEKYTEE
ncbi:acetate--CoA ligase [Candidatus Desantisbacteria bacterium CG1_02_38_46]|uniref:Acetyl-coenzyme A synthetase n=3 Tax=unclassified Candidatus Desantisiibacteriota TaxID=3106372 RepID=A0A2H9PAL6_9BACT|nr:MAG: acetate--CoA ligase [Candidatus Desantisbacteria bacterium CG1_02_38_46]PIU51438.1 MAG: acetate--CoA ligase [Candidatus Desantisbacteria bacterium CG07_land_8_20_14_0_80_39_15]PIZ15483.1 MAG: acetate--CoA ligase [Candidatus Desantisbacteria bacterium CG_4_10_14_0_8_um_filter_39_17]